VPGAAGRKTGARAAGAALVAFGLLVFAAGGAAAQGWDEFGLSDREEETADGPEIREPLFAFLVGMAEADSLGRWTAADLAAYAAGVGRESRFPLDAVVAVVRTRPDPRRAARYGAPLRAEWRIELTAGQDRPMPYSILGYHPGSLRITEVLELAELGPLALGLDLAGGGGSGRQDVSGLRIFALERGHVVLDVDGWLDALLGSGLDDSWTLGFVTARADGQLVGLAVSLGRDGRHIYGEFDFRRDKVLTHGRPVANALSRTSRAFLDPAGGNLPDPWSE
jgi:hypothetical protein